MSTTVIDPNKGTNNIPYGNRVVALITTDAHDYTAAWDEVVGIVGGTDVKFELPLVQNYVGKRYSVKLRSTTGGKLIIQAYTVTGSNTIDGAATLTLTLAGESVILESDGINVWSAVGGYSVGASYTLPAAVAGTLGGVKIAGTPASAGSPTVPVTQADGFVDDSFVDFAGGTNVQVIQDTISDAVPIAQAGVAGKVAIVGTPANPSQPDVPAVQADGHIAYNYIPAATASQGGGVEIVGTPVDAAQPRTPVLTSANGPINASITTASLVGKTIRVENGIITGFS